MSTMAKDDPIAFDDQGLFFRHIVDLSPALIHTADRMATLISSIRGGSTS